MRSTECFGSCPVFSVTIDQAGRVDFVGGTCSGRPGAFVKQVDAGAAVAFCRAFTQTKLWQLRELDWTDPQKCPDWWSDGPSKFWTARVDEHERGVAINEGCRGIQELLDINALEPALRGAAGVDDWINGGHSPCAWMSEGLGPVLRDSYRVVRDGVAVGVLNLNSGLRRFMLVDCDGSTRSSGTLREDGRRWLLIDERGVKSSFDGGTGDLGSMLPSSWVRG